MINVRLGLMMYLYSLLKNLNNISSCIFLYTVLQPKVTFIKTFSNKKNPVKIQTRTKQDVYSIFFIEKKCFIGFKEQIKINYTSV